MKRLTAVILALLLCSFSIFPQSILYAAAKEGQDSLNDEVKLGERVAESVESRWERTTDPAKVAILNMIMKKIRPLMTRDLPYEVRLIKEKSPNAFSLPGGIVYITTGMFESAKSDDELAAVISHEMVHADKQHVLIQMERNKKLSLVAIAVMIAGKGKALPVIVGNLSQVAISNSYSKDLEKEADIIGIKHLFNSGFAPAGMVTLLEALAEEKIRHPWVDPGIYMDHPYIEDRISYIIEYIRSNKWPLCRKDSLNLLKTEVNADNGKVYLNIDGQQVCEGPDESAVRSVIREAKKALSSGLQLETLPYDIQVLDDSLNGYPSLYVGNTEIIRAPLPKGMTSLGIIRDNIVDILLSAKKLHPVTDFLQ